MRVRIEARHKSDFPAIILEFDDGDVSLNRTVPRASLSGLFANPHRMSGVQERTSILMNKAVYAFLKKFKNGRRNYDLF